MLARTEAPPDYKLIQKLRAAREIKMMTTPGAVQGAKMIYATDPIGFIEDWCDSFDPRNAGRDKPIRLPFVLFPRQ
jgi:phage terminase large subunit